MIGKIGLGSIVTTFILSSLSPYLLIFTVPVFVIGVVLLWCSRRKILSKILWTILPVLLWFPASGTFMFLYGAIGTATSQKLDFIFPSGFRGNAIVVGNSPCGQPVQKKDSREQLFIPSSGILLYQGEIEVGYINHRYYYQLNNGRRQSIPERANYMYFDSEKNPPPTDVVGVWLNGTTTKTNSEANPTIEYSSMTLTIESKDSINSHYDTPKERLFQSMTDSLIRDCEKKRLNLSHSMKSEAPAMFLATSSFWHAPQTSSNTATAKHFHQRAPFL